MRMPLRFRFFLWLFFLLLLFIAIQTVVFTAVEVFTWRGLELDGALQNHLMEVVIGVGLDFVALPVLLAAAWWISHKMVEPVKTIAATARRISAGALNERISIETLRADEMQELGSAINEAFDRYHFAMERLTRFSGDASHQLRTPLAAIRAGGEVSLSHDRSPAEYRETIGAMLEDLNRLTKIVDQLLMLARLDGAEVARSFEPTDLADIITRTVDLFRPLLEDSNISLVLDLQPTPLVSGNSDLLAELLSNLLDNASRHTPPAGKINIGLSPSPNEQFISLTVKNSGSRISEVLAKEIFHRFSQAPGETSGSGLGLAIVADIAQAHGGHASLDSTEPSGACFHVQFPVDPTESL